MPSGRFPRNGSPRCGIIGYASSATGGVSRLAVPEKRFGLLPFLAFFDRCGIIGYASSATGGA